MNRKNNKERKDSSYHPTDIDECILCSGSSSNIVSSNSVFGETFNIALCNDCELYYFEHQPSEGLLDNFYAKKYFLKLEKKRFIYFLKSWFAKLRASSQYVYIQKYTGKEDTKSILEIGSADGTFLAFFKKNGWDVRGFELNDYMIEKAREKHNIVLEKIDVLDVDPKEKSYDIIALSHVLEHMQDPVSILTHCKKLLKTGGFVFIELPHSPLPFETSTEQMSEYLDTTHLYNFRPKSMTKLILKSDLKLISIDRFFYNIPNVFKKRSGFVGKTLMTGKLYSVNPVNLLAVLFSIRRMNIRFLLRIDPMKKIPLNAKWQGLGDSLRCIAG